MLLLHAGMLPLLKRLARLSGQLADACLKHQGTALHYSKTKLGCQGRNKR